MILHVKNMVCNRCVKVVREELEKTGLHVESIRLGEVEIREQLKKAQLSEVREILKSNGFDLINDKETNLIEKTKTLIINHIHYDKSKPEHENFSDFLARELSTGYSKLSKLFSSSEGITIEQYIILQKIEKTKELLVYNELTLSEIAWELGYSSVQHLSSQFKKVTGLTPTHFKKIGKNKRRPLDKLN